MDRQARRRNVLAEFMRAAGRRDAALRPQSCVLLLVLFVVCVPLMAVAQAPPPQPVAEPGPPARFSGSVMVGAAPAPVGAVLEAWVQGIQETRCAGIVLVDPGRYSIEVPRDRPGCGIEGAPVIFRLDGRRATPEGVFASGRAVVLNLQVSDVPPPPPPPPIPASFAAAVFADYPGWVYLAWVDTSQLETRFELERWQPAGTDWRVTTFTLGANVDEALDQPGAGTVYYRLRACRDLVCSAWTDFISVAVT